MSSQKFELGKQVMTCTISQWLNRVGEKGASFLKRCAERYLSCDWGEMEETDLELNNDAVESGDYRIFASYDLPENLKAFSQDEKIWFITEWDRSATTVLFPSDY